jgi:hypothetical protein
MAACGSSPTSPTTTPTTTSTTQVSTGTLQVLGTDTSVTFGLTAASPVAVTFASLVLPDGTPVSTAVKVGIGTSNGTTCTVTASAVTAAGLTAQVNGSLPVGTGCVSVTDVGGLPNPATYAVRIIVGTSTTATTTAGTDTFISSLAVGGVTTRTFLSDPGAATVTLVSAGTTAAIKMGVGLWDGSACRVTTSALTFAGGGLMIPDDQGQYCAQFSDPGVLTTTIQLSATIAHP